MIRQLLIILLTVVLGCLASTAKNTALLIGIGNYKTSATGWPVIHGNNDVKLLETKLKSRGFSVSKLTDNKATKGNIKKALTDLTNTTASGDVVYIHFSGHGQLIEDLNHDERGAFDQSFICYDACFSPKFKVSGKSYRGENHFIDDELFPYLNDIKQNVGKKGQVVVVFDSCYSGGADRNSQPDELNPDSEVEWTETTRGTDDIFPIDKTAKSYLQAMKKPGSYSQAGGMITVISACKSDQRNYECKMKHSGRKYGTLSYCISKMLDKNLPMGQWGAYFTSGKYKDLKVFRPSQHPVVQIHK